MDSWSIDTASNQERYISAYHARSKDYFGKVMRKGLY